MAPSSSSSSSSDHSPYKTVCVMDASGRLGSTLVQRLLQRGYAVHAAVQNHDDVQSFTCDDKKKKKLKAFHSDPLDYHSILDALKGCCGLFYTFEPPSEQPTYDEYMGEMEVRAAHNVLEACAQTVTIEKVVFTSSATAVVWRRDHTNMDINVDERNWSDIGLCKKFKLWHGLSKTLAEKTAWALAMDRGVNMVSINGGLIMSPELSIRDPYLKGAAEMYEGGVFVTVDLRFLVDAHICVFEDVSAYGRYLCFNRVINSTKDALNLANMLMPPPPSPSPSPSAAASNSTPPPPPPSQSLEDDDRVYQQRISNKKLSKIMHACLT